MMEVEKEPIPPDDLRCKRNDGRGWRCKRFALPGKTLCEPHLNRVSAQKKPPKIKDKNTLTPDLNTTPTKPIRIRIRVKPEPCDESNTPNVEKVETMQAMLALPVPKAVTAARETVTVARAADVVAVVSEDTSELPSSSSMRGPRVKRPNVGADVVGISEGMRGPRVKRPGVAVVGDGGGDELEERENEVVVEADDVAAVKKGPRMKRPNLDIGGADLEERENVGGGGDVTVAMRGPRTKRPNVGVGADVEEGEKESENVGIVSVDVAAMRGPRTKRPGNAEDGEEKGEGEVVKCSRHSGKGWRCGKAAKEGYLMCEDHLTRSRGRTDAKFEGKSKGKGKEKEKEVGVVGEKRFAVEEGLPDELRCTRNDGKDWRCKRRVVDGQALCEAHFKGIRLIDIKAANVGEKEKAVVKKKKKAKEGMGKTKEKKGVSEGELMVVKEEVESEKDEGMLSKLDMVADVAVAEAEGREEGKDVDEEEWRCKRTDGRDWRCKRRVWEGKTMCEIHYEQGKLRQKRITVPESLKLQKGDDGERIEKRLKKKRALETLENNSDKGMKRMKAELIRVFLRREIIEQNKKGGVKSVTHSHSGEITRDLPYGLMEIPPAPPVVLENARSLGIKVGVQSSNTAAKRRFRSKNIEPSPVGPLKVVPFAGNLGKVKNGGKKKCHWCQNSENLRLTKCLSCRNLFFCSGCIKERNTDPEEVKVKCPVCCGSCDCKACCATLSMDAGTQETEKRTPKGSKFHQLQYLITLLIPILEQINQEQNVETETEARFKGQDLSEVEIRQADVGCRDQCCCNNCKTPILDFHRSCPNCSYNLCISCCREYSQGGCLRGADNSDSQLHNVMKTRLPSLRNCSEKVDKSNSVHSNGGADHATADPVVPSIADSTSCLQISCPPMELGGCDNSLLDLRCIFPLNWTKELEISAKETFPGLESPHSIDDSVQCSLCAKATQAADNKKEVLEASNRTKAQDNFVYCPSSSDDQYDVLDHFQIHWRKGHPIKVRNVLQCASPLSFDPVAMFCSCLEDKPSNSVDKKHGREAVNCTDCYEVEIGSREYFARSLDEGCTPRQKKTLRVKAKLSSTVSRRHLGDHYSEIIHALPLQAYTNPRSGLLNIAGKLPEEFPDSKLGPHVYISFGSREVVARGELLTKLHYNSYDVVNVLAHAADATCSTDHLNKISVLITQNNKQDQISHNLENDEMKIDNEIPGEGGVQVQCPEQTALHNGVVGTSCNSPVTNGNSADIPQDDETTAKLQISGEVGGQDLCSDRNALQNGAVGASCCSHVINGTPTVDPQNDKSIAKLQSSDADSDASVICSATTNGGLDKSTDEMTRLELPQSSTLTNKSSSSESCGAYWDVFRRQDVPKLLEYINKHIDELSISYDFPKNVVHPIFDGSFYLDSIHKMQLKEEFDIEPWTFNQCLGEAVFIPAGCPYQMRNVKSCVNIALGFISPENASESIKVINEIRALPNNHTAKELKLEVEKMIICSIDEAIKEIYRLKIEEAGLLENGVQISIPNS